MLLERSDEQGRPAEHGALSLWALGSAEGATELLVQACTDGLLVAPSGAPLDLAGGCVPRGVRSLRGRVPDERLPDLLRRTPTSVWDWFSTTTPPAARPGEEHVRELVGRADRDAASAAQAVGNPHAELTPHDEGTRWWGWYDGSGTVRSVVGARLRPSGWELGGIGTDPAARGLGAAAATLAVATRAGLEAAPRVVLGMYAANVAGRALYDRAGFRVGQEFVGWRTAE